MDASDFKWTGGEYVHREDSSLRIDSWNGGFFPSVLLNEGSGDESERDLGGFCPSLSLAIERIEEYVARGDA